MATKAGETGRSCDHFDLPHICLFNTPSCNLIFSQKYDIDVGYVAISHGRVILVYVGRMVRGFQCFVI